MRVLKKVRTQASKKNGKKEAKHSDLSFEQKIFGAKKNQKKKL
jgi:hypothetical protein